MGYLDITERLKAYVVRRMLRKISETQNINASGDDDLPEVIIPKMLRNFIQRLLDNIFAREIQTIEFRRVVLELSIVIIITYKIFNDYLSMRYICVCMALRQE